MIDGEIEVHVGPGDPIRIREGSVEGEKLGYFDETTFEIVVEGDQPESGKMIILLHELLHFAETHLIEHGVLDGRIGEEGISQMSRILGLALMRGGLGEEMPGSEEAEEFLRMIHPNDRLPEEIDVEELREKFESDEE